MIGKSLNIALFGLAALARVKTFFQSASPALIPMRLVNRASPFEVTLSFASIHTSPMNASFEEARAA